MTSLRYEVRLDAAAEHLAEVTLRFRGQGASTDVTMPSWCPGSYLIRDYARFVRDLRAQGDGGAPLTTTKVDKATWRIDTAGHQDIELTYRVYGHDLTVRTNHIDETHAFLHGPATFMYPVAQRRTPIELTIDAPREW